MVHQAQMFDLCDCLTTEMLDLLARIQLKNMIIPQPAPQEEAPQFS